MRRGAAIGLGALVLIGGVVALLAVFTARDDSNVATVQDGLQPDRGRAHDTAAAPLDPADPVASGPHRVKLIPRDARELDADAILHALELGNVVILYGQRKPPPALLSLQERVAGPFDVEIAAAGQAVVLARLPGLEDYVAMAWRRVERAREPQSLEEFAEAWLGRGA
jgi:hypothetical protein